MEMPAFLQDPKQRVVAAVAGVALLVAAVVLGRALLGGGAKVDPQVNEAVKTLQNETPPEAAAPQAPTPAQVDPTAEPEPPIDETPSSGKRPKKPS